MLLNLQKLKLQLPEFPILNAHEHQGCPKSIPWEIVEPYEKQAIRNHDQDLATLAYRGGLDPVELYWVMTGMKTAVLPSDVYQKIAKSAIEFITKKIIALQNAQAATCDIHPDWIGS